MTGLETVQKKLTDINRDYILENLYIGMRRCTSNEIIKRESIFEGIEEYLYLRIPDEDAVYSVMMFDMFLDRLNLFENSAWECAEINVKLETEILRIEDMLSDLLGENVPLDLDSTTMFVITNKSKFKGSAGILDTDKLYSLASDYGCRNLICLPSSIHEWIVIPHNGSIDMPMFNNMVQEVNQTVLEDDREILSDRAYIYDTIKEVAI